MSLETRTSRYFPGVEITVARTFILGAMLLVIYRFTCLEAFYLNTIRPEYSGAERWLPGLAATAWKALATSTVLLGVPVTAWVVIERRPLAQIGFTLGDARSGVRWVALFWTVMIPVLFGASFFAAFRFKYPLASAAADSASNLVVYEALMLLYFLGWEFFFRGYLLFALEAQIGNVSAFVQMVPFAVLHGNKPLPEALGAIVVGIVLGYFALRTRTFLYCVLVHFLCSATMDVAAIWGRGGWNPTH